MVDSGLVEVIGALMLGRILLDQQMNQHVCIEINHGRGSLIRQASRWSASTSLGSDQL